MPDGILLLNIKSHETKLSDDGQARIIVKDMNNKRYTHFISEEDGTWSKQLTNDGMQVYVYLQEKQGEWKGKPITYRNIYKPRDEVPPVPPVNAKGIPIPIPINPPALPDTMPEPPPGFFDQPQPPETAKNGHAPYISEKDTKIRWMNSITNATHVVAELIDIKKHGEPEIKNLLINYANFFNELESGMTYETLPISKAQVIELHNRLTYHGIAKLYYHEVLEKILGKRVIKTTDLTYTEAAECLKRFDDVLSELNQAEMPKPSEQASFEDDPSPELPF